MNKIELVLGGSSIEEAQQVITLKKLHLTELAEKSRKTPRIHQIQENK
jgi:hypothetical protein